jgi:(p)ppGpp synthase/HD superfamily hydrolase
MKEWIAVLRAADDAARWHVHQRRKGAAQEPYVNHLLEEASLVATATEGREPDVVVAALLHDAIEDQNVTPETIASEFGQKVGRCHCHGSNGRQVAAESRTQTAASRKRG